MLFKVDNHVHLASAMQVRDLGAFVEEVVHTDADEEVLPGKSLKKVGPCTNCESAAINSEAYASVKQKQPYSAVFFMFIVFSHFKISFRHLVSCDFISFQHFIEVQTAVVISLRHLILR